VRADIATDVAAILLDGDLLGHTTHGLALLAPYLDELANDQMAKSGEPEVLNRRPAAESWDGKRLPGPWLTLRALERATAMARVCGTGSIVIRRSHHIACLAAYLKRATDAGLVAVVESSDPTVVAVAPHGGLKPFITPNPIAAGLPTSGDPILIDVSTSITSMGYALQQMKAGKQLPGPWLIDHLGNATRDPGALLNSRRVHCATGGATQHKGCAGAVGRGDDLSLAEQPSRPVGGLGRDGVQQVYDPEAFGGLPAFKRQMDFRRVSAQHSGPAGGRTCDCQANAACSAIVSSRRRRLSLSDDRACTCVWAKNTTLARRIVVNDLIRPAVHVFERNAWNAGWSRRGQHRQSPRRATAPAPLRPGCSRARTGATRAARDTGPSATVAIA
jgi:L-lactate dehydrogenase